MPDLNIKKLIKDTVTKLKRHLSPASLKRLKTAAVRFISSWWKLLLGALAAVIFLYYPLGAWLINNIDRTTGFEIETPPAKSATIDTMAFLINREVNDHMWTPNLPFIFPSYILDNMPAYQLGIMSSIRNLSDALAKRQNKTVSPENGAPLQTAAELLQYPGNIWMFSPQNKLVPAPSSTSQYKKARKMLIVYNHSLGSGHEIFYKNADDLAYFLKRIAADLEHSTLRLENHIRENSSSYIDTRDDDLFFYQQGKLYGYFMLTRALARDYKDIIVARDIYQPWIRMNKALEDAALLDPLIIRNGELDSLSAPNHLSVLGYYTLKAASGADQMQQRLMQGN